MKQFVCSILLVMLAVAIGCDSEKDDSPSGASGGGESAAAPVQQQQGGSARGRLLGADQKPITAKGAKLSVNISGISSKSGERLQYNPPVKPDGSYEQRLVDGSFRVTNAQIELPYNGKNYRLPLEPVQDNTVDQESSAGIVQDFVWKISGLRHGQDADPTNHTHWYGGAVTLNWELYRNDLSKSVPAPADGTKVTFTLTPDGPLINGQSGDVRTMESTWTGEKWSPETIVHDVPIGKYTMTGTSSHPDGSTRPLVFEVKYANFEPSMKIEFPPDLIMNHVNSKIVGFAEKAD